MTSELVPVEATVVDRVADERELWRRRAEELAVGWLHGYTNALTRNAYGRDIGLSPEVRAALPDGPANPAEPAAWSWIPWALNHGIDPAGQLTKQDAEAYAHVLEAHVKRSRQRRWAALVAFYRFLRSEEIVTCNPDEMVRRRTMGLAGRPPSPTLPLHPRQVQALYLAATLPGRGLSPAMRLRRQAMLAVLAATGCRAAELVAINLADYRPQVDGHALIQLHGKGEKDRWVMLPAPDAELVDAYLEVRTAPQTGVTVALPGDVSAHRAVPQPLFTTSRDGGGTRLHVNEVQRTLDQLVCLPKLTHPDRKVREAAKILAPLVGNIHPHQLRHTYVTVAVRNGVSIVQVSDDLGHARLDTTQTYLHTEGVENSAARVVSDIYHRPEKGKR